MAPSRKERSREKQSNKKRAAKKKKRLRSPASAKMKEPRRRLHIAALLPDSTYRPDVKVLIGVETLVSQDEEEGTLRERR